jgi:hypothetical protein
MNRLISSFGLSLLFVTAAWASTPIATDGTAVNGTLEPADTETIPATVEQAAPGYLRDLYTFEANAGDTVDIQLQSGFDGFLVLLGPDGSVVQTNDDAGSINTSRIALSLPATGTYTAVVTSYGPNTVGAYTVSVHNLGAGAPVPGPSAYAEQGGYAGQPGAPGLGPNAQQLLSQLGAMQGQSAAPIEGTQTTGTLAPGDTPPLPPSIPQSNAGYLRDIFPLAGTAGTMVSIDLTADFDCYLMLLGPGGNVIASNDDFGTITHSRLTDVVLPETGNYQVVVTSFGTNIGGNYTLTIGTPRPAPPTAPDTPIAIGQTVAGSLASGDTAQMPVGNERAPFSYLRDGYVFQGVAGQGASFALACDFDAYLVLLGPDGSVVAENDDYGGSTQASRIDASFAQTGPYRLIVTSLSPETPGNYTLTVSPPPPPSPDATLAVGQSIQGALMTGDNAVLPSTDERSSGGYLRDGYAFSGTAGSGVRIDLSCTFDGYLYLVDPSGQVVAFNDDAGSANASQIQATLSQTGTYRIVITSFGAGDQGGYTLSLQPLTGAVTAPAPMPMPMPQPQPMAPPAMPPATGPSPGPAPPSKVPD